jgi:hypothetical protein
MPERIEILKYKSVSKREREKKRKKYVQKYTTGF